MQEYDVWLNEYLLRKQDCLTWSRPVSFAGESFVMNALFTSHSSQKICSYRIVSTLSLSFSLSHTNTHTYTHTHNTHTHTHTHTTHTHTNKPLTLRRLMSYIYIYMEHPFLMFLDHTQRRSTVGRTPLDE